MDNTERPWHGNERRNFPRDSSEKMEMERRLRDVEQAVIRVEEQAKTIFHWMESHEESEKMNHTKLESQISSLQNKTDEIETYIHKKNHQIISQLSEVDAKRILSLEKLSDKMDKMMNTQNELIAMKNKWGGVLLALTFMGGAALTISGVIMDWFKAWIAG